MSELRMPDCRLTVLAGRLGNTPELRRSSNDTPMCSLRLAVDCYRAKEREKDTLWLDIDCFGRVAELASEYAKGTPILVEGNLDVARWKDKLGEERSKVVVKANRVQRLDWADREFVGAAVGEQKDLLEPGATGDDLPF
jgi:single stranded DNA-binding protein